MKSKISFSKFKLTYESFFLNFNYIHSFKEGYAPHKRKNAIYANSFFNQLLDGETLKYNLIIN